MHEYIKGIKSVSSCLSVAKRKVIKLVTYDRNNGLSTSMIIDRCKKNGIPIEYSTPHTMNIMLKKAGDDGEGHQNYILKVKEMGEARPLSDRELKEGGDYLVLYNLTDPQNLGAIIRSVQYIFGSSLMIILVGKQSLINGKPSVLRASAGAMEQYWDNGVRRYPASIKTLISEAQDKFINVIGTEGSTLFCDSDGSKNSIFSIKKLKDPIHHQKAKRGTLVIMGSEGLGIGKDNLNLCNYSLSIRSFNNNLKIDDDPLYHLDSLNVSVSAGIILANWFSLP